MKIHAQISPTAREQLKAQKRTSTITSVTIAILVMGLIALTLLIIALKSNQTTITTTESYIDYDSPEPPLKEPKVNINIKQTPSRPPSANTKVLVTTMHTPFSLIIPKNITLDLESEFGDNNSFDEGFGGHGSSFSPGGPKNTIPGVIAKRCTLADRLARLKRGGGNEACENAVIKSLDWFKETQAENGSWEPKHNYCVGMTGLALLAFLGHCETAQSENYGETVYNAIIYLIGQSLEHNGKLGTDFNLFGSDSPPLAA